MIIAEIPKNEEERLEALKELALLDTEEERIFDDVTKLAAQICGTQISLITLIDERRQWFKSHYGIELRETSRDLSFCSHAIHKDETFVIEDATQDERFFDNPLVAGGPRVRFYAGAPLALSHGNKVGTLCVIDQAPKKLNEWQKVMLESLASHVVELFMLRRRVEGKDLWMAIISHEFRSPLNTIVGFSLLLQKEWETLFEEERIQCLEAIVRSSNSLLSLTDDLVDLYRIQADFLVVDCQSTLLSPLVKEVFKELQPMAKKYNRTLLLGSEGEWMCQADRRRLKQVLLNLVSNAIKYSKDGSAVQVHFEKDEQEGRLKIHVINEGEGISPEDLPRLFHQFGRLGHEKVSVKNKIEGIGLGLFLTKKIVEKMNGALWVKSVPHQTTDFTVAMPLPHREKDIPQQISPT